MPDLDTNVLSCCDNLDILRRYLPDASVDLVSSTHPSTRTATPFCDLEPKATARNQRHRSQRLEAGLDLPRAHLVE